MKSNEQLSVDFYEKEATTYDDRRWNTPAGKYNDTIQKEIVLDLIGNCNNIRVLDIATGTGRFALEIAKSGAHIIALDSSSNMLDATKLKFQSNGLIEQLDAKQGLATEIPVDDNSVDVCVCINALNHIERYLDVLKEIYRVLKPGGLSITSYTNWMSPYMPFGLWVNLRKTSVTRDVYTKWFNPLEVFSLHKLSSMKIELIRGELHFPTSANNSLLLALLKATDRILRHPPLGYLASQLFVKARK